MTVQEFLKKSFYEAVDNDLAILPTLIRPRVVCSDGFNISIQASYFHYCTPQVTHAIPYTEVELGYPSEEEPLIMDYIEYSGDDPTHSVYCYVPIDVVEKVIEKHGGIVEDQNLVRQI